MDEPLVVREDHGPVVVLTLNRPDRHNALSKALVAQLGDALSGLAIELGVRAIVITGAGRSFCSGMDLKEAEEAGRRLDAEKSAVIEVRALADLLDQLHTLPKPVVAALNGDALAGGAGLALSCDFVIAAEGARIGYPEVLRGLVPAMVLYDLVRQAGERRARALVLSGQPITVSEAREWGIVNRVVPPESLREEALALATRLVAAAPLALASTKRLLDESSGRPRDLRGAAAVTAAVRVSDEAIEGLRAFVERRPPRWAGSSNAPEAGSP
ncbi:MAG: enoyl-CoA hydratase/isomerase family protein [Isosphaeraceae bacterium]